MRAHSHPDPVGVTTRTRDPKDDDLVALAVDARADAIISGDAALLAADLAVQVRSPRAALHLLRQT
ncbi:MAG: hypothetical protein ACRDWI_12945 [Jiangellaceae bacterium]